MPVVLWCCKIWQTRHKLIVVAGSLAAVVTITLGLLWYLLLHSLQL